MIFLIPLFFFHAQHLRQQSIKCSWEMNVFLLLFAFCIYYLYSYSTILPPQLLTHSEFIQIICHFIKYLLMLNVYVFCTNRKWHCQVLECLRSCLRRYSHTNENNELYVFGGLKEQQAIFFCSVLFI